MRIKRFYLLNYFDVLISTVKLATPKQKPFYKDRNVNLIVIP